MMMQNFREFSNDGKKKENVDKQNSLQKLNKKGSEVKNKISV